MRTKLSCWTLTSLFCYCTVLSHPHSLERRTIQPFIPLGMPSTLVTFVRSLPALGRHGTLWWCESGAWTKVARVRMRAPVDLMVCDCHSLDCSPVQYSCRLSVIQIVKYSLLVFLVLYSGCRTQPTSTIALATVLLLAVILTWNCTILSTHVPTHSNTNSLSISP